MGFNSAFEGLSVHFVVVLKTIRNNVWPRAPSGPPGPGNFYRLPTPLDRVLKKSVWF